MQPIPSYEIVINDDCISDRGIMCAMCADVCTEQALYFGVSGLGMPIIDQLACSGCDKCVQICPACAITLTPVA